MIAGNLFTREFLLDGIRETEAWRAIDDSSFGQMRARIALLLTAMSKRKNPVEAETESDVVYPILDMMGWSHRDAQPNASAKARHDVPDALLYPDAASKAAAAPRAAWKRFAHGACIVEAKRWERVLDREEKGSKAEAGTPSSQMLRYLRRVDDVTNGKLRWGILTNGRAWRLYHQGALSVAEDFLEIDLGKASDLDGCGLDLLDRRPEAFADDPAWRDHVLKLFVLLFGLDAFLAGDGNETFHQLALREGKRWETKVARTLSDSVFDTVFPVLADALASADPKRPGAMDRAYLDEVRHGALVLLYRLLFVLYAEDRNLLPDASGPYAPYCLTRIRSEVAEGMASRATFSSSMETFWHRLNAIFRAVAKGDDDLGIPPYNGGLFDPANAAILGRVALADSVVSKVVFGLSHTPDPSGRRGPRYINYRDLSVQQLGSVYERILEFDLRVTPSGVIEVDADEDARHTSGSYYTPEELVTLVIRRTVAPLVEDALTQFRDHNKSLAGDERDAPARLGELAGSDPAVAILSLKVCDPAMGSGHFLVSLVDWLADEVLRTMAEATAAVAWGTYVSPLAGRIGAVRERIVAEATAHGWPLNEHQLDDRHVVRRMVLKRVVYGVDKNPMAVELAKVALWLHSFTVGAPLSFLDHHLRSGNSVVGAFVGPTLATLRKRGALFNLGQVAAVERVAGHMKEIEETTDNDVAEVASSKTKFGEVARVIGPVAALFSLLTAERMLGVFAEAPRTEPDLRKLKGRSDRQVAKAQVAAKAFDRAAALQLILEGIYGDPFRIADGRERVAPVTDQSQLSLLAAPDPDQASLFTSAGPNERRRLVGDALVAQARDLAKEHDFFHWEVAYPNVWSDIASDNPTGGFDAVIGNPPYVRQELLGDDVKRALQAAFTTFDSSADLYVYFYEQGLQLLRPGGRMGYVVTNKWLKAAYAEGVRELFADRAWIDFVADFGHAKHFFPDADVFPSVLVARKPAPEEGTPETMQVCAMPRGDVPKRGLLEAVEDATFPLPRALFTKDAWVLEPKPVLDLMDKVRRAGVPLTEVAGTRPLYGIKTGLNRAFLVDTATRDGLVKDDPACADLIRPCLRGQDVDRWWTPEAGLHMIVLKSSANQQWPWADAADGAAAERIFALTYPSLHKHLKAFESYKNAKGKDAGLRHREDQGRFWWELRSCDYYAEFFKEKIVYQVIQFFPSYTLDDRGRLGNDKTFIIPTDKRELLAALNAPITWWFNWRNLPHLKDEALSPMGYKMEALPVPRLRGSAFKEAVVGVDRMITIRKEIALARSTMFDWLRHEYGLSKLTAVLESPEALDGDAFVKAVRRSTPRSQKLSASDIGRLKQEHVDTLSSAGHAAVEFMALERRVSGLVNAAYGLTREDLELMRSSAPPRMPFTDLPTT